MRLTTISGMAVSIADYNRRVNEWMRARWRKSRECPLCGKSAGWELAPLAELPIRSTDFEGQQPDAVVPVVPLICKNCAYVVFSSAVAMGVLNPPEELSPAAGGYGQEREANRR
jgi:hypothetical protein